MTKVSFSLDPNAQAYTDDEIVAKVNAAAAAITRVDAIDPASLGGVDLDDIGDGTVNKGYTDTEKTKLSGVAEGADVNVGEEFTTAEQTKLSGIDAGAKDDQSGAEIRDAIVALADVDRKIVITDPVTDQFKVISLERKADGKMNVQYDDVAET